MSDLLLPYYNRELTALARSGRRVRRGASEDRRPAAADGGSVDDPHVARLLEGVAFLAARVHHRLDDEFPELTDALLGVLYPHYLAPMPSCAIAQFLCKPDLDAPYRLPAGISLGTEPVRGETCRYRTAWPQTLWPIEIESVRLSGLPLAAPANPRAAGAVGRAAHRLTLPRPARPSRRSASTGCAFSCVRRPTFRCRCWSCCRRTRCRSPMPMVPPIRRR